MIFFNVFGGVKRGERLEDVLKRVKVNEEKWVKKGMTSRRTSSEYYRRDIESVSSSGRNDASSIIDRWTEGPGKKNMQII